MRCHRNTSILRLSKPRLNLHITPCLIRQVLLPVIGGILISPGKKLPAAQTIRGNLQQSIPGFIHICNILRTPIRNIKKVIYRFLNRSIIRNINALHDRKIHLHHLIFSGSKRLHCRHDHSALFIFRNCHITPPVHRNHFFSLVHNTHPAIQKTAVFFQPEIHLISHLADSLILIHTQNRFPVLIGRLCRIKLLRCKRIMTDHTDIPFHATTEPRIAHSQITELQHIIGIQQILSRIFIPQLPQSSAKPRKKYGL